MSEATSVQVDPLKPYVYSREVLAVLNRYLNPDLTAEGEEAVEKAMAEYAMFHAGTGVHPVALKAAKDMMPHVWWRTWGDVFPTLQGVACMLLSKQPSASPCERNWSALDVVLNKRHCSMLSTTLSKLLRVRQHLRQHQRLSAAALGADPFGDLLWAAVNADGDDYLVPAEGDAALEDAADMSDEAIDAFVDGVLAEIGM